MYKKFADLAQWLLDPVDPANFAGSLATQQSRVKVLVQEVDPDHVVPNSTTIKLARLMELGPDPTVAASAPSIQNPPPTPEVLNAANAGANLWLEYRSGTGSPVSEYFHGSIYPAAGAEDEIGRGTRQMQVDAVTFLLETLQRASTCQ